MHICVGCDKDISYMATQARRCDDCSRKRGNWKIQLYRQRPEIKIQKKQYNYEYRQRSYAKELKREYDRKRNRRPEVKAHKKQYHQLRYARVGRGYNSKTNREALRVRDGSICSYCNTWMYNVMDGKLVHVDHIFPQILGGCSELENLQLLHASCNNGKGTTYNKREI